MEITPEYVSTGLSAAGVLRLPGDREAWRGEHLTGRGGPIVGTPRRPMLFAWEGEHDDIVGASATALFSNRDQVYRKSPLTARGETTDWVWLRPEQTAAIVAELDPAASEDQDRCFRFMAGPTPPAALVELRRLTLPFDGQRAPDAASIDPIAVDEAVIRVVTALVRSCYSAHGDRPSHPPVRRRETRRAHVASVNEGAEFIATRFSQRVLLEDVARAGSLTPLHFCRIFKRETGMTVHTYLSRVRLAEALERLADHAGSLGEVARACGFSSGPHLSDQFLRHAGLRPTAARNAVLDGIPGRLRGHGPRPA